MGVTFIPTAQFRVYSAFFLYALALGGIYTRLGDIQLTMGIKQGALGAALIGIALGTQISLLFARSIVEKTGHRLGLLVLIPLLAAGQAFASLSSSPFVLFLTLALSGLAIGTLEVIVNLEADRVEHQLGRRIMNRAHAFWSFGFFAAGLTGLLAKQLQFGPFAHLAVVAVGVTALVIFMFKDFSPAPPRRITPHTRPLMSRPTKAIMALVFFSLSAMLLEGAGVDWSIIYMRDVFDASVLMATLAFSLGALSQAILRYFADGFIDRFGPQNVAKTMLILLGGGAALVTFAPGAEAALLGFVLIGAGASTIFPLAMSAAAQRTDRDAATNVAALAQISFITFLVAPPLLGFIGEYFGIRVSFGVALPLVALSWFTLYALVPESEESDDPRAT